MSPAGFEQTARLIALEGFKAKILRLKKEHAKVSKQFNALCDELDRTPLNEEYLKEVTTHLTIYLSELDLIESKIKDISDVIQRIITEISN